MSTIASPRPSFSASSRRTSTSTETGPTSHAAPIDRGNLRRNRAALRDYYGLKSTENADAQDIPPTSSLDVERESELDKPGFDGSKYVTDLLAKEGADGVLKTEAILLSEIRTLDGERKALVYDNYSKLIAATDTIKNMREKMDPLTPTTSTLSPAIGHIAETAASLSSSLQKAHAKGTPADEETQRAKQEQQATVRWVLSAPVRLQASIDDGRKEEAEQDWEEVRELLDRWKDVKGVTDVREKCLQALGETDVR